jgi:8-oxo-dGTP pyrophosphatase MutT (NUDIX family)
MGNTVMNEDVELKFQGKVIAVSVEDVVLPNGETMRLERIHHPGGAVVAALNEQMEVCLLKQYRYIAGDWLWELPAGKIDNGEAPEFTAKRELREEAGVEAAKWRKLGYAYSSPGLFEEVLHFYFATELVQKTPRFDPHEVIEIHWLPIEKVYEMLERGEIVDGKSMIGLYRLRHILNEN